jgi:hypothetical protein
MNHFLIFTLLTLLIQNAFSQPKIDANTKNIAFAEVAGAGGFGSVNYERKLIQKNKFKSSIRGGLGAYHVTDYEMKFNPDLLVPLTLFFYYGEKHHIDFGFGETISSMIYLDYDKMDKKRSYHLHTNFSLGYRYQKSTGGLFFKLNYTPFIEYNKNYKHWGSASLGYAF